MTACVVVLALLPGTKAKALPSFAVQTGQPCAACHVGAIGPQLTSFGRDFKLYGYTAVDVKGHWPAISFTGQESFTHTEEGQQPPPRWFAANDNPAIDEAVVYYAGRITANVGAFVQAKYDGVARNFGWDNSEIRYAHDGELFKEDMVWGITVNNAPSTQDIWNSFGAWSYPYLGSALAPTPAAALHIESGLNDQVLGAGAYISWNSLLFLEVDAYKGLDPQQRNWVGNTPVSGTDQVKGTSLYWRAALEHGWAKGEHYIEVGTYGLTTEISPQNMQSNGHDSYLDTGVDATYQWFSNPKDVTSDFLSAHTTYGRERLMLNASQGLFGTNASDSFSTFRADVSYAIAATVTPTVQYFRSTGSHDPALYGGSGAPDSSGMIAELAYVPWGKPDDTRRANLRLALQYVDYFKFEGTSVGAHANNTLFLNLTWAFTVNQ